MLSLSLPCLTSLAPTSIFTSHPRHFLQRKPFSVSIPSTTSKPSLPISSFKPSHLSRRFQLAVKADSLEPEGFEEEEEEEGEVEEEADGGSFEVVEEEEGDGDNIFGFLEGEEEGEEAEEEDEEEEEDSLQAPMVLKFIWMEKNIGLALEKLIPGGKGSVPLTPYYFWPRKDAWEELKAVLEEKGWVSQKRMIILLNQATDIINLWQQSGAPTV